MKTFMILAGLFCYGQVTAQCCPYVGGVTVLPENPAENDNVRIVTTVTTPNIGELINRSFTVSGYNVELNACYYEGMATMPTPIYDTVDLGMLSAGTYIVYFTAYNSIVQNHCVISDTQVYEMSFNVGALGLSESQEVIWNLYPNPAHERVTISGATFPAVVRLLSADGRELKAEYVEMEGEMILDVHVLPSGLYLIEVNEKCRRFIRK